MSKKEKNPNAIPRKTDLRINRPDLAVTRQLAIGAMKVAGLSNNVIAKQFGISPFTVSDILHTGEKNGVFATLRKRVEDDLASMAVDIYQKNMLCNLAKPEPDLEAATKVLVSLGVLGDGKQRPVSSEESAMDELTMLVKMRKAREVYVPPVFESELDQCIDAESENAPDAEVLAEDSCAGSGKTGHHRDESFAKECDIGEEGDI